MWKYLRKHHLTPRSFHLVIGGERVLVDGDNIIRDYPKSIEQYLVDNPLLFKRLETSGRRVIQKQVEAVDEIPVIFDEVESEYLAGVASTSALMDNESSTPKRRGRPSRKKEN
jgi:hypothetical protein